MMNHSGIFTPHLQFRNIDALAKCVKDAWNSVDAAENVPDRSVTHPNGAQAYRKGNLNKLHIPQNAKTSISTRICYSCAKSHLHAIISNQNLE
jgi:hypothetical protein